MRFNFGKISTLCLILSVPFSAHAGVGAPDKNPSFDAGTMVGKWVATQCDDSAWVGKKLTLSYSKGGVLVAITEGAILNHLLNATFESINGGPKAGAVPKSDGPAVERTIESYTFNNGIYKTDKSISELAGNEGKGKHAFDLSWKIESLNGGAGLSLTAAHHHTAAPTEAGKIEADKSISCSYKRDDTNG